MKITYGFYTNLNKKQVAIMKGFGITLETGCDRFEIEKGELSEQIEPYMKLWNCNKYWGTNYTKKELDAAETLEMNSSGWTNGYPQPDDTMEWKNLTYDVTGLCSDCGTGLIQNSPFRLKRAPNWNNKQMFDIEWVYDVLFVKKETYEELLKPLGIDHWPVLLHKKETVIADTVQLKIPEGTSSLDLSNQPYELCSKCGNKKYINQIEGLFPRFTDGAPSLPIFKSKEYCGSGHVANKWIFVSQDLRHKLIKRNIKGHYRPVHKSS